MLLINNDESKQLLNMKSCMEVLEETYKLEGLGWATNRNKSNISVPTDDPDLWYRFSTMEGGIRQLEVVAIRLKTDMYRWPVQFGLTREIKYCVTPGRYCGLVLLFSAKTAEPLAIINDGYLQHMRVGATAGLAAKCMARKESSTLGIIGSGGMAKTHAMAYREVRPLGRVKVYSPNREHRMNFARELGEMLEVEAVPMDDPQSVVQGSDIVCTCTDTAEPVLFGQWLEPGMHISIVQQNELAADAFRRIERFVEYRSGICAQHYATPEEQRPPSLGGSSEEWHRQFYVVPPERRHVLPDVLLGKNHGRESDREINLFNCEGTGIQFAAVGWKIYEQAKARGLGRELPLDWFLQEIRD